MARNVPLYLLVHTSVSDWGTEKDIDSWHRAQGFVRGGYHYVIENGYVTARMRRENKQDRARVGLVTVGRPERMVGAHCVGYNSKSLGICLIGDLRKNPYEPEQIDSLITLLAIKCRQYKIPIKNILGHYETPNGKSHNPPKTCPDLDMKEIREKTQTLMREWGWL